MLVSNTLVNNFGVEWMFIGSVRRRRRRSVTCQVVSVTLIAAEVGRVDPPATLTCVCE